MSERMARLGAESLFRILLVCLFCLGVLGCSLSNPAGAVTQPGNLDDLERSLLTMVNQYRRTKGLPLLASDGRIAVQARKHSADMASGAVPFGHDGFAERVAATGIPCLGAAENVAMNAGYGDPAAAALQGWLQSPGHRANIEGNYNLTGIGAAKNPEGEYYFTQIFLRNQ